jgi:hypothetical protein
LRKYQQKQQQINEILPGSLAITHDLPLLDPNMIEPTVNRLDWNHFNSSIPQESLSFNEELATIPLLDQESQAQAPQYSTQEYEEYIQQIMTEWHNTKLLLQERQDENHSLQSQMLSLTEKEGEITALKEQLEGEGPESPLEKTRQKCRGLQSENHALHERGLQWERKEQILTKEVKLAKEATSRLEKELDHLQGKNRDLMAQVGHLQMKVVSVPMLEVGSVLLSLAQCEGSKELIRSLDLQVDQLQVRLESEILEKGKLEKIANELEAKLDGEAAVRERVDAKLSERKSQLQVAEEKLLELENQSRVEKVGLQKQIEEYKKKVRDFYCNFF